MAKRTTLTGDSASISSRCLPSIKFQMLTFPSLPPEASRLVFWAMSRVLIWALCPTKVYMRLITELSHTLMVLSQEAVTTMGVLTSWKYLTQETQSWWGFWSTVNLQTPWMFQILTDLSMDPEQICLLSGEKATERTSLVWWMRVFLVVAVLRFQSLMVPSHEEERQNLLSWERSRSEMKWECPFKIFLGAPKLSSFSEALRSQMMRDWSLDPEMRNSLNWPGAYSSSPTFMQVTQPPCPLRYPL
mmetsp:Transcript_10075/g.16990  ORF Transcript_10075/g.16990 Transcript_10075/m.16990 type:complete len:245 (+) Transcript_10075:401-1135(+)